MLNTGNVILVVTVPVNEVGTLGALIGVLAAALVVVITGWIVSCVYFRREINK